MHDYPTYIVLASYPGADPYCDEYPADVWTICYIMANTYEGGYYKPAMLYGTCEADCLGKLQSKFGGGVTVFIAEKREV